MLHKPRDQAAIRSRLIDASDRMLKLAAGVGDLFLRSCGTTRHYIINYHHVAATENEFIAGLGVHTPLDLFVEHLDALRGRFRFVHLNELAAGAATGRLTHPCVALTFDDGFRSVMERVAPVLREFGACATLFPPTAVIGNEQLLFEHKLALLINSGHDSVLRKCASAIAGQDLPTCMEALEDLKLVRRLPRPLLIAAARDAFEALGWEEREIARQRRLYLDRSDIRSVDPTLFRFGSHGVRHVDLTGLDNASMHRELRDSRETLENLTAEPIDMLALPFGRFDDRVIVSARQAGYRALLSLEERPCLSKSVSAVLPRYIGENIAAGEIGQTLASSPALRSMYRGARAWRWERQTRRTPSPARHECPEPAV